MKDHIHNNNNDNSDSLYATRRTRFQAAPDWMAKESLILVNEIAAVEADCSTALSSYQQWNIIAGNCAALDVVRNLGQCRRKWETLLSDYEKIRSWELKRNKDGRRWCSYWSLKSERVRKVGLPEGFDRELFEAIGEVVRAREERGEAEVESDGEGVNEKLDFTVEIGSKRKRHRSKSERHHAEKPKKCPAVESSRNLSEEQDPQGYLEEEPEKHDLEEEYLKDFLEEKPKLKHKAERLPKGHLQMSPDNHAEVEPHENRITDEPKPTGVEMKAGGREEEEETVAMKLQELAVKIQAIGIESADYHAAASQNAEDYHTEFTRCQGDKLIASLGNFADTFKQLCDLLQ